MFLQASDTHLWLLENGQALEQDPNNSSPVQHQVALLHATHTMKTVTQSTKNPKVIWKELHHNHLHIEWTYLTSQSLQLMSICAVIFTYLLLSSLTSCIFTDHQACAKNNLLLLTTANAIIGKVNHSLPLQSLLLAMQKIEITVAF